MLPKNLIDSYNGFVGSVQPENSQLGDQLAKKLGVLKLNWKFSRDGGAIGAHNLKDAVTLKEAELPAGAIICNSLLHVKKIVAGTGADAMIGVNTTVDVIADAGAEGAPWHQAGLKLGIPDFATIGDYILTTEAKKVVLTVEDAALTDGEFDLYLFYVLA